MAGACAIPSHLGHAPTDHFAALFRKTRTAVTGFITMRELFHDMTKD
jgi:hypothetical protein